jgi:inositol-phosphate transport system permease protein
MNEVSGQADAVAASGFARAQVRRQRVNFALFLGPALILLACFFIAPVIVDLGLAFTDMDRTLAVTRFTLENFERMVTHDSLLVASLGVTAVFVLATLGIFNVTFALLLALTTTAVPRALGAFFRAVWLLPRMSPSVVYALLWLWVIDPGERGLLNQVLVHLFGMAPIDLRNNHPLLIIIVANGFIGASLGMIIFTSAIRAIPEHLFHAARADGAGILAIVRHIVFPAMRWPISYMTIHQTLSLLVSFEYILLITGGGPFYDTTVFSLYAYRRAFDNGQYAYGAALSLILIVIGVIAALLMWRLMDMRRLLQVPRIEVH